MSLLDVMSEQFHIMVETGGGSGAFGGDDVSWIEGRAFTASAVKQSTTQARIAQVEHAIGNYLITATSSITLKKGDYIRRDSDGAVFKITEPNVDSAPPKTATFSFTQAYAESSSLPISD